MGHLSDFCHAQVAWRITSSWVVCVIQSHVCFINLFHLKWFDHCDDCNAQIVSQQAHESCGQGTQSDNNGAH